MAKKRTWLWILVGVLGFGVVCVVAMAGFGIYFISHHVKSTTSTSADAFKAFDEARGLFKDATPLFELDRYEEPRMTRRLEDMPTGARRPQNMHILAWDPDRERLSRVSMPFWMLRLGKQKIDLTSEGLELQRLQLNVDDLERVGPLVLFDYRPPTGQRVLVWTQ